MNNDFINNSNYYIPEDKPRKKKKRKKSASRVKKQHPALIVLSVLLSVLLTVNLICAILLTSIGGILKTRNIERLLTSILNDIEISEIEIPTEDGSKTLSNMLLDMAYEYRGFQGITEDDIDFDKLEDFAKLFIVQMFENSNVSSEGVSELGLTPEQIYNFIEGNQETIRELLIASGYEGNIPIEENKEALINTLKKHIGDDGVTLGSIIDNFDETGTIMSYVNTVESVFSTTTALIVWCLAGILALVLLPVNLRFFGAYLRSLGIPMMISGLLVCVTTLASGLIVKNLPIIENETVKRLLSGVFDGVAKQINGLSVTILIIGIMLTVISIVADAVKRRKNA